MSSLLNRPRVGHLRHIIQRADQSSCGLGVPSWWLTATKNTQNRKCKECLKWI